MLTSPTRAIQDAPCPGARGWLDCQAAPKSDAWRLALAAPIDELLAVMDRLRGPQGCPWDREQTLRSLQTFLLEEAHEVLEAMEGGNAEALREELGDLLFQIVFQSRI